LEANRQVIQRQTKDNFDNGKEYVGLTETPFQNLMLDRQVLRTNEKLVGHKCFYHKKWYDGTYGLGVFRKGTIPNDDLQIKRCSRLFILMNGCNILLNCNMWFRVVEIKIEQGLL
jgi:hypothetical protein